MRSNVPMPSCSIAYVALPMVRVPMPSLLSIPSPLNTSLSRYTEPCGCARVMWYGKLGVEVRCSGLSLPLERLRLSIGITACIHGDCSSDGLPKNVGHSFVSGSSWAVDLSLM